MSGVDWRAEVRRYAAPVLLLAAVTAAALFARGALRDERTAPASDPATSVRIVVSKTKPRPPAGTFYVVQSGDTFGAIAERFATRVERLVELNPGVDPRALHVGRRVRVG